MINAVTDSNRLYDVTSRVYEKVFLRQTYPVIEFPYGIFAYCDTRTGHIYVGHQKLGTCDLRELGDREINFLLRNWGNLR